MTYKLTYFNFKGAAEPIRFLLAYSEIDYEDNRIDREQWAILKPTTPFGKIPILEIDGKVINQAGSICRFLAKNADLVGDDDWESLMADISVDNIRDLQQAFVAYYLADESAKSKLFETLMNETVPFCFGKLESQVNENDGYFVNGKLTWADLYFAAVVDLFSNLVKTNLLEEYTCLQELKDKVLAIPQIKSWVETRPDSDM